MTLKTLLCIVKDLDGDLAYFDHAIQMARSCDAHLEVLCLGVDRVQTGFYYAGATALIHENSLAQAESEARALQGLAEKKLASTDIRWNTDAMVVQWGAIGPAVEHAARYTDLVILPRPYGPGSSAENEAITESALFLGPTPVLTIPPAWSGPTFPKAALVASNLGPESIMAARAGLPFLQKAGFTDITIVEPPHHGPDRSDPGGALSVMFSRHGIRAEISILAKTMPRIADVLIRHATDRAADLVVMGAYGHSRLREAVLGGPTRDMLADCPVPVLMAH